MLTFLDVGSDEQLVLKGIPTIGLTITFLETTFRNKPAVKVVTASHQFGWVAREDLDFARELAAEGREGVVTGLSPWKGGGKAAYTGTIEI